VITDVAGVRVGHWTDPVGLTGCTVVLLPPSTVASGEVRGGAPGTREFALLEPGRLVEHVHAVVLTGGSAFGLAACDGVMRWCEERGAGFPTRAGVVPIVVGMVLFDLAAGADSARPDADAGYTACELATGGPFPVGRVGAGTGATYAKWAGSDAAKPGGIGTATERSDELVVAALVAVNAVGDLYDPARSVVWNVADGATLHTAEPLENTTIGVVATNARLDKTACHLVAQSAHDGLARAIEPAHTLADGDAFVAAATGAVDGAPVELVRVLAARAVERAIRGAVSG
jgi:L-aminopeptidase/D-esterase-like protein